MNNTPMGTGWLGLCLYPEPKLRIVRHFIQNPELRQNQTQVSQSIQVPQVSVSRNISDLVALRILVEERHGRSAVYSLNHHSLLVDKLLRTIIGLNHSLLPNWIEERVAALSATQRSLVEKVILFGSAARGELTVSSDIDLLVITSRVDSELEYELHSNFVAQGSEVGLQINLHIETSRNYANPKQSSYVHKVKTEGIVLWTE